MSVTKADGADWGGGKGGGGLGGGNDDTAMSPLRAQAQFGTAALAGYSPNQAAQMTANMGGGGEGAAQINRSLLADAQRQVAAEMAAEAQAAKQLQDYIAEVERRQAGAMMPGWMGGIQGINLRNIGGALGSLGALRPSQLATAMRDRVVTNDLGQVIGVYDERGILTGQDPEREAAMRRAQLGEGGQQQIVAPSPDTGQCPDGYIFDEDLQACRLDTGAIQPADYTAPQTYGMMGLLDTAPTGLLEFGQRFGLPPVDFSAANQAFRRAGGTVRQYPGYTLL